MNDDTQNPGGTAPASPASVSGLLREIARGLTPEAQHALRAVARTPEAQFILAREDEALQARRRQLLDALAEQPHKRHADRLTAAKDLQAATELVQRLQAELRSANTALMNAQGRVVGLACQDQAEAGHLERELEATADPRCDVALGLLRDISSAARAAFHAAPTFEGKNFDGTSRRGLMTNIDSVETAQAAIAVATTAVQALKRQALPYGEMTAALLTVLAELNHGTAGLALNILELNASGEPVLTGIRTPRDLMARADDAGRKLVKPAKS
jgi:hypothetical protein